jgi:hypothetical protein
MHLPTQISDNHTLLIPSRYKVIREESLSDIEAMDCEKAVSVNSMVCLHSFKSPSVTVVKGLPEESECSDEDDDILYTVYADAKGNKPRKGKRV